MIFPYASFGVEYATRVNCVPATLARTPGAAARPRPVRTTAAAAIRLRYLMNVIRNVYIRTASDVKPERSWCVLANAREGERLARAPAAAIGDGGRGAAGDEHARSDDAARCTADQLDAAQSEHGGKRDAQQAFGQPHAELARHDDTGYRAGQKPRHCVQVDIARDGGPEARPPEERGGVKDVGPADLGRRQREDEQHHQPEERPAAHGRETDDETAGEADREGEQ